jgi:MOB kinase activator 1
VRKEKMQADYELHKKSRKTLKNMGDLKAAVLCPDKEHLDEWLAVHSTSPLLSFPHSSIQIYFVREQDHISILNLPSNSFSFVSCHVAVDFFNHVNILYGSIGEFCTPQTCRIMTAGPKYAISNVCCNRSACATSSIWNDTSC